VVVVDPGPITYYPDQSVHNRSPSLGRVLTVVSFDIDGTLEFGDPPGPVVRSTVSQLQAMGVLVGSCSDRTVREQSELWDTWRISPGFVVVKTQLGTVAEEPAATRLHVGDTEVDATVARTSGFEYYEPAAFMQTWFADFVERATIMSC
jgi:predicted mannosyl-3-phosphoglycerate phosphatase (HAD superfamily)